MKYSFLVLSLLVAAVLAVAQGKNTQATQAEFPKAKNFTAKRIWAEKLSVEIDVEYKHGDPRPIILHLWGPWCAPCRSEFPALMKFAEAHLDVSMIAVSVNNTHEDVLRFLKYVDFPVSGHPLYVVIGSTESIVFADDHYHVDVFPTTLFIDTRGRIVKRIEGSVDWASPAMEELVTAFKAGKPLPKIPEENDKDAPKQ